VSQARRYILQTLSASEQEAFEERLFQDAAVLAELEAEETELLDLYVAGQLREAERQAWESYAAARPGIKHRERFARALASRMTPPAHSWWKAAALAATLLIGFWWVATVGRPPAEAPLAVVLTSGIVRGSEAAQLIQIGATVKELSVDFKNLEAVRGRIREVDTGKVVWEGPVRNGVSRMATLGVGDFVATLENATGEEIADYSFRVTR
jgi:anti-sigma-K factor RskA